MTKTCTKCGKEKPLEEFPKHRRNSDGRAWWCKTCHSERSKEWRKNNPEKAKETLDNYRAKNPTSHRRSHLRRTYGIEEEEYDRLLEEQGGGCAICGAVEADAKKRFLCVDHIEGTTKIRGILCSSCNSAIGLLKHDPALLVAAMQYLEKEPVLEGVLYPQGVHRTGARAQ